MKSSTISITIAVCILIGTFLFVDTGNNTSQTPTMNYPAGYGVKNDAAQANQNNVTMKDGKQIVEIRVRGGYAPRVSNAKAGVPTVLRFITDNTFDCSSSIRIPKLGVSKMLPTTGETDIPVDNPEAGMLQGSCGMGMYRFAVEFR
jgi:hypothetical protein